VHEHPTSTLAFMCTEGDCDDLLLIAVAGLAAAVVGTALVVGGLTYLALRTRQNASRTMVAVTAASILVVMSALLLVTSKISNDLLRSLLGVAWLLVVAIGFGTSMRAAVDRLRSR
jgi:hypothetical protein